MGEQRQFFSGFGANLSRNFFAGFGAYAHAMSPSRLCYAFFLRGLAHPQCLRTYPSRCARARSVGAGRIVTNKPTNAPSRFINAYNPRMCTLNVYGSANKQTNTRTLAFYKGTRASSPVQTRNTEGIYTKIIIGSACPAVTIKSERVDRLQTVPLH